MSAPKSKIMSLLKEKSNKMNDKFQRLQSELNRALKQVPRSVPATGTNQRMHHEIKIEQILSEFSFEMNKLEGKYINLCQTAFTSMDVDDEQMSLHGSSEKYIDSEDGNTSNHHNDSPTNATETKSVTKPDTYCKVCHRDFITQTRLKEHHLTVHSDARPFQCSECPKTFKLNRYLLHHIREVHNGYPFPCDLCDQRFKFQNELNTHQKSHNHKNVSNDDQFSLHDANEECINSKDENTLKHHNESNVNATKTHSVFKPDTYCSICDRDFKTSSRLKEHHLTAHSEERPFQCTQCPETFKLRKFWAHHIREVHNGYPYLCTRCHQRFKKSNELREHEKSHDTCQIQKVHSKANPTNYHVVDGQNKTQPMLHKGGAHRHDKAPTNLTIKLQCEHCEWTTKRRNDLFIHIRKVHDLPPFKCEVLGCGATFHWNRDLQKHHKSHKTHHQQRINSPLLQNSNNPSGDVLKCPHCGKACSRPCDLYDHIRRIHNLPPFKCEIAGCGATFLFYKTLKKHKSSHFDGSHRNLVDDSNLRVDRPRKRRRVSVSADNPLQCSICDKRLKSLGRLREHELLHGGETPFACHLCTKAFVIKRRLVAHLLNCHQVMPFSCDVCHAGFAKKMDLDEHQRECLSAVHIDGDADAENKVAVEKEMGAVRSESTIKEYT